MEKAIYPVALQHTRPNAGALFPGAQ